MHLEVRIHRWNITPAYIMIHHHQINVSMHKRNIFPKIIPLLDDLRRIHDELQRVSLRPYKMVFVFEVLDHLLSSIFINSVSNRLHRIKPNGIKQSCRAIYDIQRCLAAITRTRELAFVVI
ncbi:hypothetical protein RDWZM_000493 [Blomia tropicalis]|uniref:Uncharacterized protein n=1 Tax=Blomia tropicalis TaxID=40697 RepID=A0A9Q0RN17_BLOTA|nr:hypothetical protein RDWZM_000493 [Blomia tropicalis]